ncbi:hypothetical protein ACS0TY_014431 [Phlomoides rotata]
MEPQIRLEVLRYLTNKSLERKFSDQKLSGLLILTNFTESHGPRAKTVRLLNSAGGWGGFPSGFGGQLLPWRLTAGGFASSLLSACHF